MITRQATYYILTICLIVYSQQLNSQLEVSSNEITSAMVENAFNLSYSAPDSAVIMLDSYHDEFIASGDTISAIHVLINLANLYGHRANYKSSYDYLWKALITADKINDVESKISIYNELGRYYSFFKRKDEAFKYLSISLDIAKSLVNDNIIDESKIARNYYYYAATYNDLEEFSFSKKYMDSCYLYFDPKYSQIEIVYLKFEEGRIKNANGNYKEAINIYNEIKPWYEKNKPAHAVLLYAHMGDSYHNLKNYSKADYYYNKSLEVSAKYRSHVDFTPLVYEKLAGLYNTLDKHALAFEHLLKAKELDRNFFDSRSVNNRPLLEIQDAFRIEQDRVQNLIQEQRLSDLEHKNSVGFLQKIILGGGILILIITGFYFFKYQRSKHRAEKNLLKKEREMEIQKANEMLEIKNKELATSTLKLIEKDEILNSLKDRLSESKDGLDQRNVRQIARSIKINNAQNWEEFETRFISVNKDFYNKLHQKFPKLTQGEQKLCALIKLNFSSKDMAKLMGISVESVHTSRYRLRKKFDLSRDVNLSEFIADI